MTPLGRLIFHITTQSAWAEARASGRYEPRSLVVDGFIHFGELFPHLYGALNLESVVDVVPFVQEADGFVLAAALHRLRG